MNRKATCQELKRKVRELEKEVSGRKRSEEDLLIR